MLDAESDSRPLGPLWSKTPPPPHHSATNQTTAIRAHPTRSDPTPPDPARPSEGPEQEKENTHQECTNTASAQAQQPPPAVILLKMFGSRFWSPSLTQTTEFLIFLCDPPITTSSSGPLPPSLRECLVSAKSVPQDLAGGLMLGAERLGLQQNRPSRRRFC